jgi:hypothetical protein
MILPGRKQSQTKYLPNHFDGMFVSSSGAGTSCTHFRNGTTQLYHETMVFLVKVGRTICI